ncbi:MAG: hypothetical protein WCW53_05250 [Syntrophales bacterium]|jgi:hypothetical protein
MGSDADEFKRLFPKDKIPIILSAIIQVGSILRKKTAHDKENWITRRLSARLKQLPEFRDGPLAIHTKQEILSDDYDSDYAAGEIDILVSSGLGSEVYFAIEAKRLHVYSPKGQFISGYSDYINEGMMRFILGQYAPFMENGAMLAYVFNGQTDSARAGVGKAIQKKAIELRLVPPKQLIKSLLLPDSSIDETRHDLVNRSFTIHHLFLAV